MLWYGKNVNLASSAIAKIKNKLKYRRILIKNNALYRNKFKKFHLSTFFLYLPSIWDSVLFQPKFYESQVCSKISLKPSLIFLYSENYYFFFPINSFYNQIRFDKDSSCYFLKDFFRNSFFLTFWKNFQKIFFSFSRIFFKKIKFKGKGYYIYKNKRNTIAMRFGYSHIKRLFFFYTYVKFLSKTSIIMFGVGYEKINKAAVCLSKIRPINVFTSKGVRFTRQIIYKKQGKISSYR